MSEDDVAAEDSGSGSDDGEFVQPGLDDPTARMWEKAPGWYPEDRHELDDRVGGLVDAVAVPDGPRPAIALLTPHASLAYSGPTAADVFARVQLAPTVIMLAPDHFGDGKPTSVWTEGPWLVPGHALEIDRDVLAAVQTALPDLESDRAAFAQHESELQLPFLQYVAPEVRLVPIAIYDNSRNDFAAFDVERILAWGTALADVIRAEQSAGREVTILATTDLVHHETKAVSDANDAMLMALIGDLDVEGLHDFVTTEGVTICGEIPTAIMMATLRELGYSAMDMAERGNSLHANPDETDVIGYPAAIAWKD